jgi:hypothetical protein
MQITHFAAAVLITIVLASSALAQGGPSREELNMAAESPAFRAVADRFIAAAVAGDAATLEKMLSPAIVARAGRETLEKVLGGQVIPFFAGQKETGRSVTVANTADASGNHGFAYYMYSVTRSGEQKPFVIYVVDENGRKTVANIVVNEFVKGRHQ